MPDNQTNSQQAPSDPVADQLKHYADSVVASDPAAAQLGHYADVLERKDKVSRANQIVSEVQSGKRPEMREQELLPVMKVASLDPETGKPTTPTERAGSAVKSFNKLWFDSEAPNWYQKLTVPGVSALTGGKFLTTPAMRESAGKAIDTIGQGVKGFGKEAAEGDSGQGVINELGGLIGGTAKWAQGTGIQAATGVQNVEKQLTGKGIDPDLANAQAAVLQGRINHGITTGEEAVGVQPESYAYAGGANVGPFLLPPYGAGELAGATTKAVRGTEALASKAVGVPMEYGAKAISGTAKAITKPLQKIPFGLGDVPRQYVIGLSQGLTDPVEIVGKALHGDNGTIAEGLARETQKSIADDQATINYVTQKQKLQSDDAVFQKKPSGQWMFDDSSPMLSKEEKEIRQAQRAMAWKQSALGAIERAKGLNDIVNYARDLGLVGTANTAVGSAIGGGLAAVNAPPGEEGQAAQSGGATGALVAGLPGHYNAARDVYKAMQGPAANEAPKAPTNAPTTPEATSTRSSEQTQPSAPTQAPTKPVEQVVSEVDQAARPQAPAQARPQVIPSEVTQARQDVIDAVNNTFRAGKKADLERNEGLVDEAIARLQKLGEPLTTESIFRETMNPRKTVEQAVGEVDQAAKTAQTANQVSEVDQVAQATPQTNEESSQAPTETVPQTATEPASERGVATAVQEPDEQSGHPNYQAIRAEAEAAKREELAGTKRKTKEQEIARAGLEAMAQAHAEHVGDDSDLVTWRTSRYGRDSIGGKSIDPTDPFHAHLLEQANLSPDDTAKLNFIESKMGKTLTADYLHAPEESEASGVTRKTEQAESGAPERVSGEAASRRLSKAFVPTSITFNAPSKTFEVGGFSVDKFLNNSQMLIPWAKANGLKAWKSLNDPSFVKDFQNGVENHKNGYTFAGKPIEGTPLTRVKPNPDYKPHVLNKDKADLLNAMMGDTSAKVTARKLAPHHEAAKADKQILAATNSPFWEPQTGETNRIRAMLGDNAKLLESTYETLRPELLNNLRTETVKDEQTLRPSGFKGDRSEFTAKGLPYSTHVAAGYKKGGVVRFPKVVRPLSRITVKAKSRAV